MKQWDTCHVTWNNGGYLWCHYWNNRIHVMSLLKHWDACHHWKNSIHVMSLLLKLCDTYVIGIHGMSLESMGYLWYNHWNNGLCVMSPFKQYDIYVMSLLKQWTTCHVTLNNGLHIMLILRQWDTCYTIIEAMVYICCHHGKNGILMMSLLKHWRLYFLACSVRFRLIYVVLFVISIVKYAHKR